ncbi:MAG TPA: hypothetical protein VII69_01670 [Candidatus Eremiobacteraceae bacterium]
MNIAISPYSNGRPEYLTPPAHNLFDAEGAGCSNRPFRTIQFGLVIISLFCFAFAFYLHFSVPTTDGVAGRHV